MMNIEAWHACTLVEREMMLQRVDRLARLGYNPAASTGITTRLWRVLTARRGRSATAPAVERTEQARPVTLGPVRPPRMMRLP
jgi:hypothetical protein